jgi:hypothetical protein
MLASRRVIGATALTTRSRSPLHLQLAVRNHFRFPTSRVTCHYCNITATDDLMAGFFIGITIGVMIGALMVACLVASAMIKAAE